MTPDEITWLTWGAIRHRPHGAPRWDHAGTHAAIKTHCGAWQLTEATAHVLAHARDPKALTPAAIRGRFTPDNEPQLGGPPRPPARNQECKTHAGHHAHNCSGCAADKLAGNKGCQCDGMSWTALCPMHGTPPHTDEYTGRAAFEAARAQLRGSPA